jgi:hypothetical protein
MRRWGEHVARQCYPAPPVSNVCPAPVDVRFLGHGRMEIRAAGEGWTEVSVAPEGAQTLEDGQHRV